MIELLIVIAVIAIIAAIAIPSMLQSQRAANERSASVSLKTIVTAQIDYRANDRNSDGVANFWCSEPSGLYTTVGAGGEVRLIEISMALADADADQNGGGVFPAIGSSLDGMPTSPKAGYWLEDFEFGESGASYDPDDDGHNPSRFGYLSWPDSYNASGSVLFIINQDNTVFRTNSCGLGTTYEVQGGSTRPNNTTVWPGGPAGPGSTGLWSTLD